MLAGRFALFGQSPVRHAVGRHSWSWMRVRALQHCSRRSGVRAPRPHYKSAVSFPRSARKKLITPKAHGGPRSCCDLLADRPKCIVFAVRRFYKEVRSISEDACNIILILIYSTELREKLAVAFGAVRKLIAAMRTAIGPGRWTLDFQAWSGRFCSIAPDLSSRTPACAIPGRRVPVALQGEPP